MPSKVMSHRADHRRRVVKTTLFCAWAQLATSALPGCVTDPAPAHSPSSGGSATTAKGGTRAIAAEGGSGGEVAGQNAGGESAASTCAPLSFAIPSGGSAATSCASGLPTSFTWESSGPVISAVSDDAHPIVSVKDPTVVFWNGKWHIYATTASKSGTWNMVYLSFSDFRDAAKATPYYLDENPNLKGYHCAPQLFYFTPQKKWYLIYQSGPPQYSTADDPSAPATWSAPKSFFATEPAIVKANKGSGGWLDFWVICDTTNCYLFFSDDNGNWYRSKTSVESFPSGFDEPVVALHDTKANLFEASNVYKLKGTNSYLALIEAFNNNGHRYFRSFTASSLDGEWTPLADTVENPFAEVKKVTFDSCSGAWTADVSHGELIRDGYDETLTIDPCQLTLLYQGVSPASYTTDYSQIPWQLGILSPKR